MLITDLGAQRYHFWRFSTDSEVVVFDLRTGATHVLDEDSADLLVCLQEGAMPSPVLVEKMQLVFPETPQQELEEFVTNTLAEFEMLGLLDTTGWGA